MYMTKMAAISAATLLLAGCKAQQAQNNAAEQLQPNATEQVHKAGTPNPGPAQIVRLVPTGSGASTTWQVLLPGDSQPKNPKDAKTEIGQGVGPTKFAVMIAPNPNDIKFRTQDPLSVWAAGSDEELKGSPPKEGIDSKQIIGPLFEQGKLVFWDLNYGDPVRLFYSIHFEGNVPPVDPIIENGGGSGQ